MNHEDNHAHLPANNEQEAIASPSEVVDTQVAAAATTQGQGETILISGIITSIDPGVEHGTVLFSSNDTIGTAVPVDVVTSEAQVESGGELKGSPRWNDAAHAATAKGLKPNSKEWLDEVRESLRKLPSLNPKPKPNHPKKDRKEGQPRQERRDERQPQPGRSTAHGAPKGQGQPQERRERPQGAHGEAFSPGFVNYSAIVSMLLKASRFRRNQYLRSRGEVTTSNEVRDFYSVGFSGPRQSGKTKYLFERFARDWSTSIFIVGDQASVEGLKLLKPADMKESQLNEMMKRVIPAQQALAELNKYTGPTPTEKPKLTIDVDPNDTNPAATLVSLVTAYMEEQRAWKEKEPAPTHPTLLPLKTVYVDCMVDCETRNLNFSRLVRYVRLGGQLPEFIICQH